MKYLLALGLIILSSSIFSQEIRTPDGRMGTSCYQDQTELPWVELCRVILSQLVITPERFHEKKVRVKGHLIVKFEVVGIYDGSSSIWLDLDQKEFKKYEALSGSYVLIEGEYDALKYGHMSQWGGAIKNITRLQKM